MDTKNIENIESMKNINLRFYNSLSGEVETFVPINDCKVSMYACGPTVYDRIHLGNARSAVIYDVLFRLLIAVYGFENVKYIQNITDVDDKIIARAKAEGLTEEELSKRMTSYFFDDCSYLNCLKPTKSPLATEEIDEMIKMIQSLISNSHAYVKDEDVLFDVSSFEYYGRLSNRKTENNVHGTRCLELSVKDSEEDFILWKSKADGIIWDSPWGKGRPGWHIECSAMSTKYLGETFDIHGGGADLKFPHHENEIAQSVCAHKGSGFAKYWIHNGFLMVNGEKMSKSLGNFIKVEDIRNKGISGNVLRFALLFSDYKSPMNFSDKLLHDSESALIKFAKLLNNNGITSVKDFKPDTGSVSLLADGMNLPLYISNLFNLHKEGDYVALASALNLIGVDINDLQNENQEVNVPDEVMLLANERIKAKKDRDFKKADEIRDKVSDLGYVIKDNKDGSFEIEVYDKK